MNPTSSEADAKQLDLARRQGAAYREALDHMAQSVAHDGGTQTVDQYLVAYAIEQAEGMFMWEDGELRWHDPDVDGEYTLKVHIDPPTFMRHDEINGRRFTQPVDTEFTGVKVERGQD